MVGMTSESFGHLFRTLLKGATLGALLGPTLAMVARAFVDIIAVTSQGGGMDIASIVVGFPVFLLSAILEAGLNGDLLDYLLLGVGTGAVTAVLAVGLPSIVKPVHCAVLCAMLAAIAGIANALAPQSIVAPIVAGAVLQWIPIVLYTAMAAWLGWHLRRGSVA